MLDNRKKTVMALGYFDSIHLGHQQVLKRAREFADKLGVTLTVFSFSGNLRAAVNYGEGTYIYNKDERKRQYELMGADDVYFAQVDYNFLSLGKLAFLNMVNKKYDIVAYVCGKDYRFGRFAKGDVNDLLRFSISRGQQVEVVEPIEVDGKKVSSTMIKGLLTNGEIEKVNSLLVENYSVTGTVMKGREVGVTLGFPTANLNIEKGRHQLKAGVYAGHINLDGKEYKAVINYGACPTFKVDNKKVEVHIIDFDGDLYGRQITVFFDGYLREVVKFSTQEKLINQIREDKEKVKNGKYD